MRSMIPDWFLTGVELVSLLACLTAIATTGGAGEPVPLVNRSPQLIAVWPADGATDVTCETELRLRFDKPVDPDVFEITWNRGGFVSTGQLEYLGDKHELVLPVRLLPGAVHEVEIGGGMTGIALGGAVAPASWRFETAGPVAERGEPAQVVSVKPPSGSAVPRLAFITVQFDKAIDPRTVAVTARRTSGEERFAERSAVVPAPEYDEQTHTVTLPVILPMNWSGEVTLTAGNASPVTVAYTTGEELIDRNHPAVAPPEGTADELKRVVGRALAARKQLRSASVLSQNRSYSLPPDRSVGFTRFSAKRGRFAFQGDRQFIGDVSGWMGQAFMVGSDGATCWFLHERRSADSGPALALISCDVDKVEKKRVLIADAFGVDDETIDKGPIDGPLDEGPLAGPAIEKHIAKRSLTLVNSGRGPADPYVVRSWSARNLGGDTAWVEVTDWGIDAETFLPTRVVSSFGGHQMTTELAYSDVNEKLPLQRFQPPADETAQKEDPAPLSEKYDIRFLQLGDGSSGRVSCRWGMTGSGGTSSSGLN